MHYVIIGNSAAGIGAAEGIRQVDKDGSITIVSDEPHHTYSRPLISYLLSGKVTPEQMNYRNDDFYIENNCTLLSNAFVKKICDEKRELQLEDGQELRYDKLLVATGSRAFVPDIDGLNTVEEKHFFMTLDDVNRLHSVLDGSKRVLIIGAGLIGLKCAEGVSSQTSQITVIDIAPRILSGILDDGGAELVQRHIESQGVNFRLSCKVNKFKEKTAILDSGEELDFDILVLASGVFPNVSLLEGICEIDKGIVVNTKSETTSTGIYAAGDCTQTLDASSGQSKVMALLPNAYLQGECAGINMAGGEKVFEKAIPMNAIGFFGLHVITAGNYHGEVYSGNPDADSEDLENTGSETTQDVEYKRLFYGDNRLNGYIMIGNVDKAGIYTSLIRDKSPLDSIDFALICEKPRLMAFAKEDRKLMLAGGASK